MMETDTRICTLDEIQGIECGHDDDMGTGWSVRLLFLHKPEWHEHDGRDNFRVTATHPATYVVTFEREAAA